MINLIFFKGSSASGVGNSKNVYCGGFLNDFALGTATHDQKIKGNFYSNVKRSDLS